MNLDFNTLKFITFLSESDSASKFLAKLMISNDICLIDPEPLMSSIEASLPSSKLLVPPCDLRRWEIRPNHMLCFLTHQRHALDLLDES